MKPTRPVTGKERNKTTFLANPDFPFNSVIGPVSYDDAVQLCAFEEAGILAPLNESQWVHNALCSEVPQAFR